MEQLLRVDAGLHYKCLNPAHLHLTQCLSECCCWFDYAAALSMGGAATTKTLMQNYSALERKCDLGWGSLSGSVLRTVTPAARQGTSHPVPAAAVRAAQQSTEKCKLLRPDWQGKATGFRVEGSYTANLWAGMPANTTWTVRWMLVTVGSCSIPTLLCLPCGQAHDAQSLPPQTM